MRTIILEQHTSKNGIGGFNMYSSFVVTKKSDIDPIKDDEKALFELKWIPWWVINYKLDILSEEENGRLSSRRKIKLSIPDDCVVVEQLSRHINGKHLTSAKIY